MNTLLSQHLIGFLKKAAIALVFFICAFNVQAQRADKPSWRAMGDNKGFTFYEVQQDFYQYWQGKEHAKGQGYNVFKRWEKYMKPRVYPSGNMALPSKNYENYMQWERSQPASFRSPTGTWTEIGPFAKPTGYDSGKGRVDFVRFDPSDNSIMYVGTPDGGLWKSTDGGINWTTNTDFLPVIGCADLAIDPTNTQTMYLATGNWENDRRSIGILKSDDGGTNWSPTNLTWTALDNYKIRKLVMDPTNPLIMMAVTDGGIFRTNDGWVNNVSQTYCCNTVYDIEFKPGDHNTVYAMGQEFYKSTDNGVSWTPAPMSSGLPDAADVSRAVLAVTPANSAYVYVLMGNTDGGYLGTYRSTNSGDDFTAQSTTPNLLNANKDATGVGGQASHDLAIAVSPTNANLVNIGGISQWQSMDGGVQWTLSSYWLGEDDNYMGEGDGPPDYVHADVQSIDYQLGSNTVLFATCDGGISKSTDNGANWTDISTNLRIAQQTGIALSASSPGIMITGLQDIGTLKNTNGAWSVINGGDGESAFIDRTSDMFVITSNPNGAHAISTDGGLTKEDITGISAPGTEFFSPISQDPFNIDLVYAGGRNKLWKTTELFSVGAAAVWTEGANAPAGTGGIIRFEVAPSNNDIIYALKYDAISRSNDAGNTWTNITGSLPSNVSLTNLAVSNANADKVWVTFSGYENGEKVYKTTNGTAGGPTWTNISTGLPNIPINTVVFVNNSIDDDVYIGADIGVYYINNTFPDWQPFSTNLARCAVTDLKIFYPTSKLRASTYGRGAWESDLYSVPTPVELLSFTAQLQGKNTALLNWKTASELNNKGFEVEWMEGLSGTYKSVGFVAAKGGNGSSSEYSFSVKDLQTGEHYFRLKQLDNDGSFEYSPVRSVVVRPTFSVLVSPNPVKNELVVNVFQEEKGSINISIVNAIGQITTLLPTSETPKGISEWRFEASNLPAGVYFCVCKTGNGLEQTTKFVKR